MSEHFVNAYVDGNALVLLHRDSGGELQRRTVRAEYVFYVERDEFPAESRRAFEKQSVVLAVQDEGRWVRVTMRNYDARAFVCGKDGPFVSNGIATYEGDVSPVRRYFTDSGAGVQRPRRAYFDLETDSRVPFSKKHTARILSWALIDSDGAACSRVLEEDTDRREHELIAEFWRVAERYDQLLAWNGDGFDFPVLWGRSSFHQIRVDPKRWLWLDHLALFKRMNTASESGEEKQSMKLQAIAMAILGEGKDDFDASKTWEAWEAGGESRATLLKYNEKDTELLLKIEEKTGFAALLDTLADVCRVFPDSRGLEPTRQMDGFMLRLGKERDIHFPTKKFREVESAPYKGAFVMEPTERGIVRDVHVADFASLYPSIILTWNMSPETKRLGSVNGPVAEGVARSPLTGQHFDTGVDGILPIAVRTLIDMRREWTAKKASLSPGTSEWHEADRRSTAYKVAANSFYGVVGSPFSRYFDRRVAESVAQNGAWLIKHTIEAARVRGMKTIYGDTDSLFVMQTSRAGFEEFVKWCNEELYPRLLREVGCSRNEIKLAYEKAFERIVFVSSKRYAGNYLHYKGKAASADSRPEIKGLEYKRGDAALLARRLQADMIDMLMSGEERVEQYRTTLDKALAHVLNDELPREEFVMSKALSKPLKEYDTKRKKDGDAAASPPHVQVARILAGRGVEVREGTRVEYYVVDGSPNKPNVVLPAADIGEKAPDRFHLWEALIYPPTMRLLQAAFPERDWTLGYEKVRPAKLRGKKSIPPGQLGFAGPPTNVSRETFAPVVVEVAEREGVWLIEQIKRIGEAHPGVYPLEIRIRLESGACAILAAPQHVSGSPAMLAELEWSRAALSYLEAYACDG